MYLTVYPNGETRARIPSPSVAKARDCKVLVAPLVNRQKLALFQELPLEFFKFPSCPWPRPGYGGTPKPRPFSLYARKRLSRAGGVFSDPEHGSIAFLTGTVPGSTTAARDAIASHSAWIVHRLMTRIPQVLGVKPSELRWMWVWEFQKRGMLHWHCVMECQSRQSQELLCGRFHQIWCAVIDGVSRRSGVDCAERAAGGSWARKWDRWRTDAQVAIKAPYRYLAKYLSKDLSKSLGVGVPHPSRWYGCSRRILRELEAATVFVKTPRERSEPHWVLTDSDAEIISSLSQSSDHTVSFSDKFKSGHTVVFYPREGLNREVREFIERLGSMVEKSKGNSQVWKPQKPKPSPYASWPDVDECLLDRRLSVRLFSDIGSWYVKQLELYVQGKESVWGDMYWVDRHAKYLLYLTSGRSGVNSGAPPIGGLTPDAAKKLGKETGAELIGTIPGLPF